MQIANPSKSSRIQIGDFINKAGVYTKPGVIAEKHEDGTVVVDTDPEAIKKYHRHSNTSGLIPEDKERFNEILDDVMKSESNTERINQLQGTIDDLKKDLPNKKLVEYLRNEQAVLIRYSKELPRIYNYEADKLR